MLNFVSIGLGVSRRQASSTPKGAVSYTYSNDPALLYEVSEMLGWSGLWAANSARSPLRSRSALRSCSIVFCYAHSTLYSAPPDFRPSPLTCCGYKKDRVAYSINRFNTGIWHASMLSTSQICTAVFAIKIVTWNTDIALRIQVIVSRH